MTLSVRAGITEHSSSSVPLSFSLSRWLEQRGSSDVLIRAIWCREALGLCQKPASLEPYSRRLVNMRFIAGRLQDGSAPGLSISGTVPSTRQAAALVSGLQCCLTGYHILLAGHVSASDFTVCGIGGE